VVLRYSCRQWHVCKYRRIRPRILFLCFILVSISLFGLNACGRPASQAGEPNPAKPAHSVTVKRGNFHHALRLSGAVNPVEYYGVQAPRLSGQMSNSMVITKIVRNGTQVREGDILAEFDRQSQMKNILDKQAECDNLVQQIKRKQADHASARAADETELKGAEVDVQTARVEMRKNDVVPGYQAETNKANLAEAEAKLKQLKDTFALKREAQAAELRILEIQRDRAQRAVEYAQGNTEKMTVKSPMDGLAVLATTSRGGRTSELQEGDQARAGQGIMMVVNPSKMQVTARVNQVDIAQVHVGQSAEIRLEAYPDLVFPGKVESIAAIGTRSDYVKRIRYFTILISIQGSNPILLPDLTAIVDLQMKNIKNELILPRESIAIRNGQAMVEVIENGKSTSQPIKIGAMNECEAIVESGIKEGATVSLDPAVQSVANKQAPGQM
jgi:HlyD family secretion protein